MQHLDLFKKSHGSIWHRKPIASSEDGLLLTITRSSLRAFTPGGNRTIRFTQVAFDRSGQQFLASDQQGNLYQFNLAKNKFKSLLNTGVPCTTLSFNLQRKNEALVALSDCLLKCYDITTKEVVCWMKGHDTAINSISIHSSGRYALTASNKVAHLWDLETFTHQRTLNGAQKVGIMKVCFLPSSNNILTCFKDDTIFVWDMENLQCQYQLPVPPGKNKPCYRSLATTSDGQYLIAGGRSRFLHLWTLENKRLIRIIQLPLCVKNVKLIAFLPDSLDTSSSQTVGVLSQDGIMRFINIHNCNLLFEIGTQNNPIHQATINSNGRYVLALMGNGNINLYSIASLSTEIKKPPEPITKAVIVKDKDASSTATNRDKPARYADLHGIAPEDINKNINWNGPQASNDLYDRLDIKRLHRILKGFGEYPSKYRIFIWRSLLKLPENHECYSNLIEKGTHSAFIKLDEEYPIKSRKLLNNLQKTLSALAHWSPIFGEVHYLPLLIFPFVKLFQNNHLICFEVIATIIVNWCQKWFEFFPNPPINILSSIENMLGAHDSELLDHFIRNKIKSQVFKLNTR
ncbi:uncharacterized protein TRIADDRAFT_30536 [Trichoplax adhaerens]|uniref:Uncharacterized protein n=1 Tax=Trichoplax adhaerens TaxID=10228 RepID=B3S7F5_TRIAD|nr:hypothetical protein TRIADDRAFT_30536 [Trichoplax adhaerens]EDV21189.1 hypothetical protein TRIADDRAFT_30536 [Trichoplax adhaerens]|eukprot:XP_002116156.1 hypothetical protein TRIADDRAFT_30536 [Trichoplax adhaerens]